MTGYLKSFIIRFRRFITFGLVGAVNTSVDLLVFTLCTTIASLPPAPSQVAGYMSGVICSFLLNRNLTFKDGRGQLWIQALKFAFVNGTTLSISTLLIHFLTVAGIDTFISKALVTAIGVIINYFGYKIIVFKTNS